MNNSTDSMGPIIMVLFVFVVIVIAIASGVSAKKRTAELEAMAQQLGFSFFENGPQVASSFDLSELLGFSQPAESGPYTAEFASFFDLFQRGSSRRLRPAIIGNDASGVTWYLFDYQYTVSHGKSSSTYHFSVVIAHAKVLFPNLTLTPENVGYSLGKLVGMRELQVESEEFNKRYFIKTTSEKQTLDLLHPIAIETLLKQPDYEWQMTGPFVMLHLSGRLTPPQFLGLKGCIEEFMAQIPAYYREDHAPTHG